MATLIALHGIDPETLTCRCPKGAACGRDAGKHPKTEGWRHLRGDQPRQPGDNVGVAQAPQEFVIDLDCKPEKGIDGVASWDALATGKAKVETLTVATGGGGYHLYFRMPPGDPRRPNQTSGKVAPGVDVKPFGGYVVGPGSGHVSGEKYRVVRNAPVAVAPPWVLALPHLFKEEKEATGPAIDYAEGQAEEELFAQAGRWLALRPAAHGGVETNGAHTFSTANILLRRYRLRPERVLELMMGEWNDRAETPREIEGNRGMMRKIQEALEKGTTPIEGREAPSELPTFAGLLGKGTKEGAAELGGHRRIHDPAHRYEFEFHAQHNAEKLEAMLEARAVAILCHHEDWAGVFQKDIFRQRIIAVDPPVQLEGEDPNTGLQDNDVGKVRMWFAAQGYNLQKDMSFDAIRLAAEHCRFHPVREYLASLPAWDGEPRLDAIAGRCFKNDGEHERDMCRKFLIAAVRRILRPGTQVDTCLTLVGEQQGEGKSSFVKVLFGEDFVASKISAIDSKDASSDLQGKWAIEFGELHNMRTAALESVKEFMTRTVEDYRQAYGRCNVRQPRQCVFVGTTNHAQFLEDDRNRRWWVIEVGGRLDLEWLKTHRDQVWAEAVQAEATGERHWYEFSEELELERHREQFKVRDEWEALAREYLAGREWVKGTQEFWVDRINGGDSSSLARLDPKMQRRIGKVFRLLGCTMKARWLEGGTAKVWEVPKELREATVGTKEKLLRKAAAE